MRHVFYSLHYEADRSRAELVRNVKGLVPNLEAKPTEWATIERRGDFAFKRWFEQQVRGRSCTIVLIGADTAMRPAIQHEIRRSWELKMGMLGIYIHALQDDKGQPGRKGRNPFIQAESGLDVQAARSHVYEPPDSDSKLAYRYIADNLAKWVEWAVAARTAQ
jgi:hypothetical protein